MKIHRLTLTNVRGIESVDVELAPLGITALYGRNEIGKSTLQLALRTAVNELHSANNPRTRALQTTANGEGPEIAFVFEVGGNRYKYTVRYLSRKTATLEFLTETKTPLQKVEAFEEMQRLLGTEVDLRLWTALSVLQGESTKSAETHRGMMGKILDELAGDEDATGRQDDLWERVIKTHDGLLKDDGSLRDEHARHEVRLRETVLELEAERRRMNSMRDSAADLDALARRKAICRQKEKELRAEAKTLENQIHAAARLEEEAARAEEALPLQEGKVRDAQKRILDRQELAQRLADAQRDLAKAQQAAGEVSDAALHAEITALDQEITGFDKELLEAKQALEVAGDQHKHRRLENELERLRDRIKQAEQKVRQIEAARALIRKAPTPAKAKAIKAAAESIIATVARIEVDAGRFTIEASEAATATVDGKDLALKAGQRSSHTLTGRHDISVGPVKIQVDAGTDVRKLREEAKNAEDKLADLLAESEAPSAEAAQDDAARAKQLQEDLPGLEEELALVVRDLDSIDGMRALAKEWERRLAGFFSAHDRKKVPDYDTLDKTVNVLAAKRDELQAIRNQRSQRRELLAQKSREVAVEKATHEGVAQEAERKAKEMEKLITAAEKTTSGESLEKTAKREDEIFAELRRRSRDLKTRANAAGVNGLREMREGLRESAERSNDDARDAELQAANIQGALNKFYEDGSRRALEALEEEYVELGRQVERTRREAEAVKLLRAVLAKHREAEREALLAPLTQRINQYCALVFRRQTQVVLDHDTLQVTLIRRGTTVTEWANMSGGLQEQVSIIHRLACAKVAAAGGGVPIFFDDTLGYASRRRLLAMIAVLNVASADLQLIVMSCDPERFDGLKAVKKVDMEKAAKIYDHGDEEDLLVVSVEKPNLS